MLNGFYIKRIALVLGLIFISEVLPQLSYADNTAVTAQPDIDTIEFYLFATGIVCLLLIRRSKA